MKNIKSALLIDDSNIDNFINHKMLESHGVTNVISFNNALSALSYLKEAHIKYDLILIDIYMPINDGFSFIDKFYELELHKTQGQICILTVSLNPLDKAKAAEKNIKFIEKPFTIEKLLNKTK